MNFPIGCVHFEKTPNMKTKAYFNWSSGKDSALALYRALNRFDIKALLTVIDSTNNRIPMHGTISKHRNSARYL